MVCPVTFHRLEWHPEDLVEDSALDLLKQWLSSSRDPFPVELDAGLEES